MTACENESAATRHPIRWKWRHDLGRQVVDISASYRRGPRSSRVTFSPFGSAHGLTQDPARNILGHWNRLGETAEADAGGDDVIGGGGAVSAHRIPASSVLMLVEDRLGRGL